MDTGKRIPLIYKTTECGRNPNCGICINDISLSSKHATIELSSDFKKAYLVEKGALNGCYINDQKLQSQEKKRLLHNDVMRFANAKQRFKLINTK